MKNILDRRDAVDFNIEWPMPTRYKHEASRWEIARKIPPINFVDDFEVGGIIRVDVAFDHLVEI